MLYGFSKSDLLNDRLRTEKIAETVVYVAARLNSPTLHSVTHLLYFADKYHLQKYAGLILNDRYIAMEHGPVPSETYNVMKDVRENEKRHLPFDVFNGKDIRVRRDANTDIFSDSEIEALDFAIQKYGRLSFGRLKRASHDASWRATELNGAISFEAFTLGMSDREALIEVLSEPHP